ncbi:MAG: YkgJ family cysteine cluster protein [Deltaproteobacteria bacterium]|nr:YkgJ family cysteine cluster protein [Deltaproteobacteria bacterium]
MTKIRMKDGSKGCRRCGTCCEKGGPALHESDLGLLERGAIPLSCLVTYRLGETVRDDIKGILAPLDGEIVKIKSVAGGSACVFYKGKRKGCGIYGERPLECRLLNCRDTSAIEAAYSKDRLARADILTKNEKLLKLAVAHEERCSMLKIARLAADLSGPGGTAAADELLDLLQYDHFMRPFLVQKANIPENMLEFLFGRPLSGAIAGLGLAVKREGNRFTLCPWYDIS